MPVQDLVRTSSPGSRRIYVGSTRVATDHRLSSSRVTLPGKTNKPLQRESSNEPPRWTKEYRRRTPFTDRNLVQGLTFTDSPRTLIYLLPSSPSLPPPKGMSKGYSSILHSGSLYPLNYYTLLDTVNTVLSIITGESYLETGLSPTLVGLGLSTHVSRIPTSDWNVNFPSSFRLGTRSYVLITSTV